MSPSTSSSDSSPGQSPRRVDSNESASDPDIVDELLSDDGVEDVRTAETATSLPEARLSDFSPKDGLDPFGLMPLKLNSAYHAMLQRMLSVYPYSGNNYKLAFLPKHMTASINQFPITRVVQQSVTQPHHLYSVLASLSIRSRDLYADSYGAETPEKLRNQASHHIRKELMRNSRTGKVDKHTILDICFLTVSEVFHKQFDRARTHLKLIGKLIPLLDITEHFDFWVSETAAHVDNQLALMSGERPVLPFTFDPGPMLPERMFMLRRELHRMLDESMSPHVYLPSPLALRVAATPSVLRDSLVDLAAHLDMRMGSRFEYGLTIGVFDSRMGKIVKEMTECVAIAKVVWHSPLALCFDAEWLCRKARAVLRSLLTIAPENNIGPLDLLGKCMESARLSILISMSHACTLIGYQTAKSNLKRFQNAMDWALKFWAPVHITNPWLIIC